ncbi:MAG: 4-(cytidine 5'-diphospho)-2-C-methyl-D-erythritol kinase [Chthoniobacterales bacterium]
MNDGNVQVQAPAKINLSLCILRRREDGFHEIETLMAPISLADELLIEQSEEFQFECDDPSVPSDSSNLVVRAAKSFFERSQIRPRVRITLRKNIPHGAGLGGGSSDAAATLLALNDLFEQHLSRDELVTMAGELGSDIPFFLARSAAICRGRGELAAPASVPRLCLLLVKPDFSVATADAYARWQGSEHLPGTDYAPQRFSGIDLVNELERPVFEKYAFLALIKSWLREQPEVTDALLSGSGSTVFGVLRDAANGHAVAKRARAELDPKLWACVAETIG